jgi:hypothetical protein
MRIGLVLSLLALSSLGAALACSSATTPTGWGNGNSSSSGGGSGGGSGSGGSGSGGSGSGGVNLGGNVGNDGGGGTTSDGGFICAPNPLNYDIPGNNCDDDGDGKVDNVTVCDTTLPTGAQAGTAPQLLNAMGICQNADATHWGIVSATLTNGHAATGPGDTNFGYQHGILSTFGTAVKPQEGSAIGVLSSGTADVNDTQDNPPYFKGMKTGMQTGGGDVPSGFPKASAGCSLAKNVNDVIDLKTTIKVPANAQGFSFDFDFFSGEWPEYVCTDFNDSFIAYLSSKAFNSGAADNISFDSKGNPVSVNIGFFSVCTPGSTTGCAGGLKTGTSVCTAGPGGLAGTGFDDSGNWCPLDPQPSSGGGATGWLTSTAPAQAGETISLEFIIWDTGDNQYDSSVLLDHFIWKPQVSATPVTTPAPPPK